MDKIIESFKVFNDTYILKGIICQPTYGHYTSLLYQIEKDDHLLKKNFNYYYDDLNNNNEIITFEDNLNHFLEDKIPFILLYKKMNYKE